MTFTQSNPHTCRFMSENLVKAGIKPNMTLFLRQGIYGFKAVLKTLQFIFPHRQVSVSPSPLFIGARGLFVAKQFLASNT
jgi:hypothetical protein